MNGPNDEGANAFVKALAQDRKFIHSSYLRLIKFVKAGPSMIFDNTPISNTLPEQLAAPVRKGEVRSTSSQHRSRASDRSLKSCELCKKSDRDTEMLLCDGCDEGG